MAQAASSALYSARLRFVEGLPARAHELSSAAERLARDPQDPEALQLLRRRLHALLASAQVFEEPALSLAVQDLIARLDLAHDERRTLSNEEIDAVIVVVASLPTYVRPSLAPPAAYSDVRELLPVPPSEAEALQLPAAELPDGDYTPPVLSDASDLRPPAVLPDIDVELPPSDRERDAIVQLDRALGIEPEPTANDAHDAHERPTLSTDPRQALSLLDPERPTLASDPRAVLALVAADPPLDLDVTIDWTEVTGISLEEPASSVQASEDERTDPGLGPPVLLEQTVSGLLPRPAVVLAVGRTDLQLSAARIEVVYAASADEAVRQLHDSAPDLVLVSADFARQPGADLVRRLKTDPLRPAPRVHVLLEADAELDAELVRELGADGVLREPLAADALEPLLGAADERRFGLREASIDDIAAQIAEEIRRGISESLRAGNPERLRADDGSELMAAAWSAIGRVRSHFAEQHRVRDAEVSEPVHPAQLLAGCRVLVADDDPAVLWFFAGLLRESAAQVLQAHNGREALELARRKQPHVVVSDILMPKLDGFGLCRELRRDVLLAQVPVVLLSWKDDLLERMRELDAGAAGYLRKEAGAREILRVLRDVLAPRTRLSQQLRAAGQVRGALQAVGPYALLELVAAARPDAHVVVRDANHVFEVDIRAGRRLAVTRTAADGSFTRGEKALMQLLGLAGGEFEVELASAPLRAAISEPLDRALAAAGRRLAALLDAVSDARLLRVSLLAFDEDVLDSLLAGQSTRLREVVALFRSGHATAEGVLREGRFAPGELEADLRELARGVAITGVWDAHGEDLVAAAQREREMP
ncbi:MAG TPA: response regulator, partial [Polyangiales bacterium]|nr:response regulator [Polyangiales bacterium]